MIKEHRQKAGLSQKQFAELFDIPIDTVKSWDSGRRKPDKLKEKLIIEKLNEIKESYSEHYGMASVDIGNNGYKVLKRKKYTDIIKTTSIKRFENGLGKMTWKDMNGRTIANHTGSLDFDYYPCIGKIVEENSGER